MRDVKGGVSGNFQLRATNWGLWWAVEGDALTLTLSLREREPRIPLWFQFRNWG